VCFCGRIETMNQKLATLLNELEVFGKTNDATVNDRSRKMLNITRDTGEFLLLIARAIEARRILEIGTSNGYSTLWLAYAVQQLSGMVITVERSQFKADMARENFERLNMVPWIKQHVGDATDFLKQQTDNSFGLIFLDSDRGQYVGWWNDLQRVMALGGLMVVDNAVSHANEMKNFVDLVQATPGYLTSLVPVGNGELLVLKQTSGR
jgi:predicted O-methyltransferase YrrM